MKLGSLLFLINELRIKHGDDVLDYEVCFTEEVRTECPKCNHKHGLQVESVVTKMIDITRSREEDTGLLMLLGSRFDQDEDC
jgi:hypothetical protein